MRYPYYIGYALIMGTNSSKQTVRDLAQIAQQAKYVL
jgi:hypothetical protein